MNVHKLVYEFKTKHKQGFTQDERFEILKNFPNINMDKFYDALRGNTSMVIGGQGITYHCDIEKAIICGIENRDLTVSEWD